MLMTTSGEDTIDGNVFIKSGTFFALGGVTKGSGLIEVDGGSFIANSGANFTGTINVKSGSASVGGSGKFSLGDISVGEKGSFSGGNAATLTINKISNEGDITFGNESFIGVLENRGDINVDRNDSSNMTIGGGYNSAESRINTRYHMTFTGNFDNQGELRMTYFVVDKGAKFNNTGVISPMSSALISGEIIQGGTLETETLTISEGGHLINTGTTTVEGVTEVSGVLESTGTLNTSDMVLAKGGTYLFGSSLINGTGTLTIEQGAQIVIDESKMGWGTYQFATGFESVDASGWTDPNGLFTIGTNSEGLTITIGSNDIRDKLAGLSFADSVNEVMNSDLRDDSRGDVIGLISRSIENKWLAQELQADTLNQVGQIITTGAVWQEGLTLAQNAVDGVLDHVDVTQNQEQGWHLWAKMIGQYSRFVGNKYSGGELDINGMNYGLMVGSDFVVDADSSVGLAFVYQQGDLETNGLAVKTQNDTDAFTLATYGQKAFGSINTKAVMAYTRSDAELEQTLPTSLAIGQHAVDVDFEIYSAGIEAQYQVTTNDVLWGPYIGARVIHMKVDDATSTLGGKDAFSYSADSVTQYRFPIGIRSQGQGKTFGDWTGLGALDASIVLVAGDKNVDTKATVAGLDAIEHFEAEVNSDVYGRLAASYQMSKGAWSINGDINMTSDINNQTSVGFGVKGVYRF